MTNKVLGLLGIARRSGHILIGSDAVKQALANRRAKLILLAQDCSPKTEKECRFVATEFPCPLRRIQADKQELAAALGLQKPVAVVAVDDDGFAVAMQKHCDTDTKEDVAL